MIFLNKYIAIPVIILCGTHTDHKYFVAISATIFSRCTALNYDSHRVLVSFITKRYKILRARNI